MVAEEALRGPASAVYIARAPGGSTIAAHKLSRTGADAFVNARGDIVRVHDRAATPRRRVAARIAASIVSVALAAPALADLDVPSGGSQDLAGGSMDLACTDVVIDGTLKLSGGSLLNVRHLTLGAGGAIDADTGTIQIGGNWTNNGGTFTAGTSSVQFRDLCSLPAANVSGDTTFANASFVTATGKNYVFSVGSTQRIGGILEIAGTTPQPIQFRSSSPGSVASINLLGAGTQQIQHVGVSDVWATGQWLAPFQTNEGGSGNANRWFGNGPAPVVSAVPTLADAALVVLAALLACFGALGLRGRVAARSGHSKRTGR